MKTKILWGTRKGAEDWQEELITEQEDKIPAAKVWALANGFDRFRISEFDDQDKPNFISTLNKEIKNV